MRLLPALFLPLACLLASPTLAVPASSVCPAPQPASSMVETFVSDFTETDTLDPSQWLPTTGNPYGDASEAQVYDPKQVKVVPGKGLRLLTSPNANGKPFKSGGVTTFGLFSQRYGHFEASIRMPHQNGMWPAFWLLPTDGSWPPEIDIVEFIAFPNGVTVTGPDSPPWFGENPATTLHWKNAAGKHKTATVGLSYRIDANNVFEPFSKKFHTYAIDWRPGLVNFFLDGKQVFCSFDRAAVPIVPMYMIISDAVSDGTKDAPGWAGYVDPATAKWPQVMDIAYVHVSQFKDLIAR